MTWIQVLVSALVSLVVSLVTSWYSYGKRAQQFEKLKARVIEDAKHETSLRAVAFTGMEHLFNTGIRLTSQSLYCTNDRYTDTLDEIRKAGDDLSVAKPHIDPAFSDAYLDLINALYTYITAIQESQQSARPFDDRTITELWQDVTVARENLNSVYADIINTSSL